MVVPSLRGMKISENMSPRPQDRIYFSFNYFQGVNDQVNQKLQAPIGYTQVKGMPLVFLERSLARERLEIRHHHHH
jgi:hypothetical protein